MEFIEKLSKNISEIGQEAVDKTKSIAEILRLNGLVDEAEEEIENYYTQIGMLYYNKHFSDVECEFKDLVSMINEAKTKIDEYSSELKKVKKIKVCSNCGADIAIESKYCNTCGALNENKVEVEIKKESNSNGEDK